MVREYNERLTGLQPKQSVLLCWRSQEFKVLRALGFRIFAYVIVVLARIAVPYTVHNCS